VLERPLAIRSEAMQCVLAVLSKTTRFPNSCLSVAILHPYSVFIEGTVSLCAIIRLLFSATEIVL
jgi:hypothetical protein